MMLFPDAATPAARGSRWRWWPSSEGLAPGRPAPGVMFHWAAATDDGMRAVDVYASRQAADQLVQEHIGPIADALGLPLPDISEFEVHNLLTP